MSLAVHLGPFAPRFTERLGLLCLLPNKIFDVFIVSSSSVYFWSYFAPGFLGLGGRAGEKITVLTLSTLDAGKLGAPTKCLLTSLSSKCLSPQTEPDCWELDDSSGLSKGDFISAEPLESAGVPGYAGNWINLTGRT